MHTDPVTDLTRPPEPGAGHLFDAFLQAMLASDTAALGALLDSDFTLTHITGFPQPGESWLEEIEAGAFRYHAIRVEASEAMHAPEGTRIIARTVTDATVYGTRRDWRLRLGLNTARRNGRWIALRAVASLW